MKKLSLYLLCFSMICLTGCSDSASTTDAVPAPPAPSEDELGDASGSPEDMFDEDPPAENPATDVDSPEGESTTE